MLLSPPHFTEKSQVQRGVIDTRPHSKEVLDLDSEPALFDSKAHILPALGLN